MDATYELNRFYERYDRAVERLPQRMKTLVHVTRCEEKHGSITFRDASGATLATVDAEGRVTYPGAAAPQANEHAAKAAGQSGHGELVLKLARDLRALDEALAEFIPAIVERLKRVEGDPVSKALDTEAYGAMEEMAERVERLEAGLQDLTDHGIRYVGTWKRDIRYRRGDCVTRDGSIWRALQDNTGDPPDYSASLWELVVRKGRDKK